MTDTFPTSPDEHVSAAANPVTGGTEAANSSAGDLITDAAAISGGSKSVFSDLSSVAIAPTELVPLHRGFDSLNVT